MKIKPIFFVSAAGLLLMLASCSPRHASMLDLVPADCHSVTMVRTSALGDLSELPAVWLLMSRTGSQYIMDVTDSGGHGYVMAKVDDSAAWRDSLLTYGYEPTGTEHGQVEVYYSDSALPEYVAVTDDGVVAVSRSWMSDKNRSGDGIAELLGQGRENPFTAVSGPAGYLDSEEGIVRTVMRQDCLGGDGEKLLTDTTRWICAALYDKSPDLEVKAEIMTSAGQEVELPGLQPIQSDFVRYVPDGTQLAFAVGLTPQFDLSAIERLATAGVDRGTAMAMRMALPFLRELDGTVAIALAPDVDGDISPRSKVLLMAHMPQAAVDKIIGMATDQFGEYAASARNSQGMLRFEIMDNTILYIGSVDGCLTVCNYPLEDGGEAALGPVFDGGDAVLYINIPDLSTLGHGLPAAVSAEMRLVLADGRLNGKLSASGNDTNAIGVLYKLLK